MSVRSLVFVLLGSIVIALVLRLPSLSLPLEGDGAKIASQAHALSAGEGLPTGSRDGLVALLATAVAAAGLTATQGVRVLGLACALLLPLLGYGLARRFGRPRADAVGVAFLLAVHPFLLVQVGGPLAGRSGVELVLLLTALLAVTSPRGIVRTLGLVAACALPHVATSGLVYLPLIAVLHHRREPRGAVRVVTLLAAVASLALSPAIRALPGSGPVDPVSFVALWVPLACLGVLVFGLPRGWRVLASADGELGVAWRAWTLAAIVHVGLILGLGIERRLGFDLDGTGGLALVPLLVLAGVVGCRAINMRTMRFALAGTALAACIFSAGLGWGTAQAKLTPGANTAALRLTWQRDVCAAAAELVGPDGWVVLDMLSEQPDQQRSLADLLRGHWVWRREAMTPKVREQSLRPLLTFPAHSWPERDAFAMIRKSPGRDGRIGRLDDEIAFGPAIVFRQDPVLRIGPWLIVELQGGSTGLR